MVNEYSYEASNFISLVSDLGGFIEIVYIILSIIPYLYNNRAANKLFVSNLYYIDKFKQTAKANFSKSTVERFNAVKTE